MEIQSLSVCVPSTGCINNCKFCVSRQHYEDYKNTCNQLSINEYYAYYKRMSFARDNGCNTLMFTGTCEPQQNNEFIKYILNINEDLPSPFKIIEIQTTGRRVDEDMIMRLL